MKSETVSCFLAPETLSIPSFTRSGFPGLPAALQLREQIVLGNDLRPAVAEPLELVFG